MKPTAQLKEEHKAIKVMLKIANKVAQKLETGEKVDPDHLEKIVDFIRTFADKCHHGKEEGLLFKAMEESGVPNEGGPIGVMLQEHDVGRNYVKNMAEAAATYRTANGASAAKYAQNAKGYAGLLAEHIDKEDNILYEIADMHLSDAQQKKLEAEFERVEEEVVGHGKHEEYHQLLHQLEHTYLQ